MIIVVEKVYSEDNGAHSWTSCEGELCESDIFVPEDCNAPENLTAEDLTSEGQLATPIGMIQTVLIQFGCSMVMVY